MATFILGATSRKRLEGVHPDLARVIGRAIQSSKVDFAVLEGVRSDEQAYINYGKGRTAAQLRAKGVPGRFANPSAAKVTWLNDPLGTKHRKQADGFGHAVDLVPWPVDWEGPARFPKFDAISAAVLGAAEELGVNVRWGADWDQDGNPRERGESDSPHFEIVL